MADHKAPFTPDPCANCGGRVARVAAPGRPWVVRGVPYILPAELPLATCEQCGEQWLTDEDIDAIQAAVTAQEAGRLPRTGTGGE